MYKSNSEVVGRTEERNRALDLIQNKISAEENDTMIEQPEEEEIERLVKGLPWEKSPRVDVVTMEIMQRF